MLSLTFYLACFVLQAMLLIEDWKVDFVSKPYTLQVQLHYGIQDYPIGIVSIWFSYCLMDQIFRRSRKKSIVKMYFKIDILLF